MFQVFDKHKWLVLSYWDTPMWNISITRESFIKQHLDTEPLKEVGLFTSKENIAAINPERSSDFQCFLSGFWIFKKSLHVMALLLNITILIPTGKELKNKMLLGRNILIVSRAGESSSMGLSHSFLPF